MKPYQLPTRRPMDRAPFLSKLPLPDIENGYIQRSEG
jgi:hypothetical protein